MKKYVPEAKLSKKARKALNDERRTTWNFAPVTRVRQSKKVYSRKRIARDRYDTGSGVFLRA